MGTNIDWQSHKDDGNAHFKNGLFQEAISSYDVAIKLCPVDKKDEKGILYKNRSACHIKLKNYDLAIDDATKCLEVSPSDVKALYRRCQAFEALEKLEEAFTDAKRLVQIEPKNSAAQDAFRRLRETIQERVSRSQSTPNMIKEMIEAVMSNAETPDRKSKAMKNLTIYAHQPAGSDIIYKTNALATLLPILVKSVEGSVCLFKIVHGLCENNYARALSVTQSVSLKSLKEVALSHKETLDVVVQYLSLVTTTLSSMCMHFSNLHKLAEKDKDSYVKIKEFQQNVRLSLENIPQYRDSLGILVELLGDQGLSAEARDATIDAFVKAVQLHKAVADFILENRGVSKLLELASLSCYAKMKVKSQLQVTENTHTHIAVVLSLIYDYVSRHDNERKKFEEEASAVIENHLGSDIKNKNLQGLTALSTLFQAAREVGQLVASSNDMISKVLVISCMDDPMCQMLGGEAIAYAATDKKVANILAKDGLDILKLLYKSPDPNIRVRGLVGLCKVTMKGGGDVNDSVMIEGGSLKLYDACKKFLSRSKTNFDQAKLACEGLAYLTVDAEVKEILVDDKSTLSLMLELAKCDDQCVNFAVCNALVNLTNSYDKPKKDPELEKIAEFAKQPVPKPHEMDAEEYVKNRIKELMNQGLVTALVNLKTRSDASKEMVARVFGAICLEQQFRGSVVQLGGTKVLLPLSLSGTEKGMDLAAVALARIGITSDPRLAFPGQRCMEVVRPLIRLLNFKKEPLHQFESLMALTNLAAINDEVRKRIMKEGGFREIESLMFEEDEMIKRAATECMCNLVQCDEAFDKYKDFDAVTERVKLIVLYCGEEPIELGRAAAGTLAVLTSDAAICKKVTEVKAWMDILKLMVTSADVPLQHRGTFVLANMVAADKVIAQSIIEDEIFEVLMLLSKNEQAVDANVLKEVERALRAAKDWKLIEES